MSSNQETTAAELLKSQTNAADTHKENSPLIERIDVPTTPFKIIGNKTVGYMLTMGQYNLTEFMDTTDDVQQYLLKNQWIIIQRMIGSMIDFNERDKELLKKNG